MIDWQKFYYPMPRPRLYLPPRIDAWASTTADWKHHHDEAVRMLGGKQRNYKRGIKSREKGMRRFSKILRRLAHATYHYRYWTQQVPRDQQRFRLASLRHYRPQTMTSLFANATLRITERLKEVEAATQWVEEMAEITGKMLGAGDVGTT